jgi:hypothetical protein
LDSGAFNSYFGLGSDKIIAAPRERETKERERKRESGEVGRKMMGLEKNDFFIWMMRERILL